MSWAVPKGPCINEGGRGCWKNAQLIHCDDEHEVSVDDCQDWAPEGCLAVKDERKGTKKRHFGAFWRLFSRKG